MSLKVMVGLCSTRIIEETPNSAKAYTAEEWKKEQERRALKAETEPKEEELEQIEKEELEQPKAEVKRRGRPRKEAVIQEDTEEE